ncbi:DHH family phosphoesterase [Bryobacter aggregatus]|uniref:DHH family phosphoesterase n=1 Tax=Bryobacter aggregatus TaxID=360054 RepID=UPI0004E10CD2|nr:DHH family phosphoesterase [Bryobacter aggregatus]
MKVRVLYHDHCFDGAASAAFFSRFLKETRHPAAEYAYTGMAHTADQLFAESMFDGDVNAIVDFKYSPNPKLTWWFDHHQSAFLTPEDARHFHGSHNDLHFFDPAYRSCTKFIRDIARDRFNFHAPDLDDLVKWADIIDGAQYPSPEAAVELSAPATQLVLVIEAVKGSEMVQRIIGAMQTMPLEEIVKLPEIASAFAPLYERHLRSIDIIREQAVTRDGVISFDLVGKDLEGYNKFVPYFLFPGSTYTVSVSESTFRTKVSVGSSPWAKEVNHNLATICERYGGGGHPRVGAISFPVGAIDEARKAAREIVEELSR